MEESLIVGELDMTFFQFADGMVAGPSGQSHVGEGRVDASR